MTLQVADDVSIRPRTPTLGATITGVDAKRPVDDPVIETIRGVLLQYKVVFLPDQHLSAEQQHAFACRLGEPYAAKRRLPDTTYSNDPGLSHLSVVSHFHSDDMFLREHPQYAVLQMLEVPEVGGDTMWADQVACYEGLSPALRGFLDDLTGVHAHPDYFKDDVVLQNRYNRGEPMTAAEVADLRASLAPNEHPLVRYLPETGRKNLWLSPRHTRSIKELLPDESEVLLQYLFKVQIRPDYVVRYRWSAGDVVIWDHRTTLHSGVDDYGPARRKGRRANIGASTPVRAPGQA
jgi:taurine dioxygenase